MSGRGRLGLTLEAVTSWPVLVLGTGVYAVLRYVGDPPYAGADIAVYVVSIVMPGVFLSAFLVVARLISHLVRRSPSDVGVLVVVLIGSALSQLTVPASGGVIAEQRRTDLVVSVSTEALFMTALWCVIALTYLSVTTYRRQSHELRAREWQLEEELVLVNRRAIDEESSTVRAISDIVDQAADDLASRHLEEVSGALRTWSDGIIRPMSHNIAAESGGPQPVAAIRLSSQWLDAAQKVTSRDPLPAVALGAMALVGAPGVLFRSYPSVVALVSLTAIVAFTVGAATFVNLATRSWLPRLSLRMRMLLLYVVMMPMVLGELVLFQLPMTMGYGEPQSGQAMSALWLGILISPLLGLLTVWIRILIEAGDETLERRQSRARDLAIQVANQNLIIRQRRAAWALALHGPVQSAMLAASIRLDRARQDGTLDEAAVGRACEPVWQALEAAKSASTEPLPWDDGLFRLHSLWDGLIELTIDVSPDGLARIETIGTCRAATIEVLTEALSNVVRHGHASSVHISIDAGDGPTLLVHVSDDGQAVDESRPQGLGRALLDDVSVSWGRSREAGVNTLRIELPAVPAGMAC